MAQSLKRVRSLKITFLVDNSVEWFGTFPPGFTNELRYHMIEQHPPMDPITGVPFANLEDFCCGAHGFAVLIDTQENDTDHERHYTLFDSGPDSRSLVRNIRSLLTGVTPITNIDRVVLSHWHADHSGGIPSFLKLRQSEGNGANSAPRKIIVDLHPDRPVARGIAPPPMGGKVMCRLPADPKFEEIEELGGTVEKHAEGHTVAGDTVYISGEIPRVTPFETGLLGAVRWVAADGVQEEKGTWVSEPDVMDERYAAVDVIGKGLVIFSSCSHAGIVNVCRDAVATFNRPIHMIVGGLHLGSPELKSRIEPTVKFLSEQLRPAPAYILPMHCSGFDCKSAIQKAFGEGCVPAGVGVKVEVKGDAQAERQIFPPTMSTDL